MDAGGLAQMSQPSFNPANGLAMPSSGLASRRAGGHNIKPLSFDTLSSPSVDNKDNGAPTPRTSRSHLLAGLRTAPKSATAATFPNNPASPTSNMVPKARNRNSMTPGMYDSVFNGPKTSMPQYGAHQPQVYVQMGHNQMGMGTQHYTTEQVLAPPQIQFDDTIQEQIDPVVQAQLMMANAYLSEQQQRLQAQLRSLQAAAQQFQGLSINGQPQVMQQTFPNLYQQQQQGQVMKTMIGGQPVYALYDPVTGQQHLFVENNQTQNTNQFVNQSQFNGYQNVQQQQQQQQQQLVNMGPPRVQVSPPPAEPAKPVFRTTSPPRRYESPVENVTPLPPPSANAFRRGHKKSSSLANNNKSLSIATLEEPPRSAGPKTASFPLTPLTGGYGPGQARAGEHPIRQPRNPPSLDELKNKPTAKFEGSKNFVTRTRRSAIHNLVRAGLERLKEARSTGSTGSISPISESTEELVETPMTDNDSDSVRSGSGSLVDRDDAECSLPSSRTSTGSWGAIGSDRPSSRQKASRNSVDSNASALSDEMSKLNSSFASLLKQKADSVDIQRKAPMLVLTNAEKRKLGA